MSVAKSLVEIQKLEAQKQSQQQLLAEHFKNTMAISDATFGTCFFKCTFVNYRHSLTKYLRMIDWGFFVETKQSQPAMLAHNGLQLLQIINEAESILF